MPGYWQNPEASAQALRGGWLHTGDVGAFDADGYLTLKDRSKDLIISGGSNIYPREVEEVLLKHAERARGLGDRPAAMPNGARWSSPMWSARRRAAELDALCLGEIARFKRPKDYVFVDALPKNNYGKILKTELRDARRQTTGESRWLIASRTRSRSWSARARSAPAGATARRRRSRSRARARRCSASTSISPPREETASIITGEGGRRCRSAPT